MTVSLNDITGDRLVSKASSKKYIDNYDKIFNPQKVERKKKKQKNEAQHAG